MNRRSKKGLDIINFQIEMLEKKVPGIYHSDPIPKPKFEIIREGSKIFCPYCSLPDDHFEVCLENFRNHLATKGHVKEFCKFHLLPRMVDEMLSATRSVFFPDVLENFLESDQKF